MVYSFDIAYPKYEWPHMVIKHHKEDAEFPTDKKAHEHFVGLCRKLGTDGYLYLCRYGKRTTAPKG